MGVPPSLALAWVKGGLYTGSPNPDFWEESMRIFLRSMTLAWSGQMAQW
jgi:hypothetical protein